VPVARFHGGCGFVLMQARSARAVGNRAEPTWNAAFLRDPFGDRKDGLVGLAAVDVAQGFQRRFRPVGTELHHIVNGR
jgi:hypothetical protein